MKFLGFNITRGGVESETFQAFSSPFRKVGDANLSLPKIDGRFTQAGGFVPFGTDNLYPQLINQLYYTSPLHAAIVDFKVNATLGGGYKWSTDGLSSLQEVELYAFESKIKGNRGVKSILYDLILHNRVYFTGRKDKKGKVILRQRVCPSKVRKDNTGDIYFTCDDWATRINVKQYKPFSEAKNGEEFMWAYEVESVGQDIYSLPSYTSANNWVFLDGEMSYLQKSNILNSVFPSFAMLFPKKPQSDEEKKMIKDSMSNLKGAENAGKAAAFFANGKEYLPSIEALPTNSNDGLFQQTTESIDSKICQAHTIDPILMGIRVSGKLGSGTDIKQAYIIFEKNVIMPLREETEYIVNQLLTITDIPATILVNDFQIIGEEIVDKTEE